LVFDRKHKITDIWEEQPYLVRDQPNLGIPVYVVERENGDRKKGLCIEIHYYPLAT
jgi:hypothetical protein